MIRIILDSDRDIPEFKITSMKISKLKKHFADAQKAHKQSSQDLKDATLQSSVTRKELKEKKRSLVAVRKDYKATRKLYRALEKSVKEARSKHLQNNALLEKLSKKMTKASSATGEKKATKATRAKVKKATRSRHKNLKIEQPEAPLSIVS
jgi:myosin heavy subunit